MRRSPFSAPIGPRLNVNAVPLGHSEKTMSHKYHLRQLVRLARPGYPRTRASSSGVYEVTRLMPADQTGEVSYRIKSSGGERAVRESEIAAQVTNA